MDCQRINTPNMEQARKIFTIRLMSKTMATSKRQAQENETNMGENDYRDM